ncbi:MAG TPA: cytochrome c oxidase assembly protein [Rhizomicrobium sp.]|nr:cytochrome c oxidase assembly protein [Rhizomicrobium sp.]
MSEAATLTSLPRDDTFGWFGYGVILVLGCALYAACRYFPAELPPWMPYIFVWPEYLATALALYWFFRGLARLPRAERPALWRSASFVLGVVSIYIVLQTRIDYYALHMFFIHRAQHYVLHHSGPFLIALGASAPALWAGMPRFLHPILGSRPVKALVDFIQHPAVAPVLFVGLIYLWLVPSLHTRVMLDLRLYNFMNESMAVDGIFFWCLILDPRPRPPARIGSGLRALLVIAVEPFQMILGAILSLSSIDFYPVYKICGRIFDISAISDLHYGGLIIWLPSTLTSFAGMIVVLVNMRINDEAAERELRSPPL